MTIQRFQIQQSHYYWDYFGPTVKIKKLSQLISDKNDLELR